LRERRKHRVIRWVTSRIVIQRKRESRLGQRKRPGLVWIPAFAGKTAPGFRNDESGADHPNSTQRPLCARQSHSCRPTKRLRPSSLRPISRNTTSPGSSRPDSSSKPKTCKSICACLSRFFAPFGKPPRSEAFPINDSFGRLWSAPLFRHRQRKEKQPDVETYPPLLSCPRNASSSRIFAEPGFSGFC
jgi:hypothetical protein